jgi:hypothetical protein
MIALIGIPGWGRRYVFLPSFLAMAFGLLLLGMYYVGYIEARTFQH